MPSETTAHFLSLAFTLLPPGKLLLGLNRTGVTQAARSERLFGLVILAWVACLRIGVWWAGRRPIGGKGHGRKVLSLVRYGAETPVDVSRWDLDRFGTLAGTEGDLVATTCTLSS